MAEHLDTNASPAQNIFRSESAPPVTIPAGYVGEYVIPGTGRRVWWTGRVAIGLLHRPQRAPEPVTQTSHWIQSLMLSRV